MALEFGEHKDVLPSAVEKDVGSPDLYNQKMAAVRRAAFHSRERTGIDPIDSSNALTGIRNSLNLQSTQLRQKFSPEIQKNTLNSYMTSKLRELFPNIAKVTVTPESGGSTTTSRSTEEGIDGIGTIANFALFNGGAVATGEKKQTKQTEPIKYSSQIRMVDDSMFDLPAGSIDPTDKESLSSAVTKIAGGVTRTQENLKTTDNSSQTPENDIPITPPQSSDGSIAQTEQSTSLPTEIHTNADLVQNHKTVSETPEQQSEV